MKVTLLDKNTMGVNTIIQSLSLCRDKGCTLKTVDHCLTAKPVPHLSALEFCWFCFMVEGVSIKTRLQQVRHRTFSSMERSTRSIDMSDAECIVPPGIVLNKQDYKGAYRGAKTRYKELAQRANGSKEGAAYVLPLGTETKFMLAANGRVWFEYLQKRLCVKHVQAEHYALAQEIYRQLLIEIPQFKYAHPCRNCGACNEGKAEDASDE